MVHSPKLITVPVLCLRDTTALQHRHMALALHLVNVTDITVFRSMPTMMLDSFGMPTLQKGTLREARCLQQICIAQAILVVDDDCCI